MISIANTQDALIADVKAKVTGLKTVDVMEGEFTAKTLQELIMLAPFVIGSYRMPKPVETERDAAGGSGTLEHQFILIVGAATLLQKYKAQRTCLSIIDDIKDLYDGKSLMVDGEPVTFGLTSIAPVDGGVGIVVYAVVFSVYD
ncbi:MAG: hypothetical protein ABSA44_09615 [Bacteroidota bacterium]